VVLWAHTYDQPPIGKAEVIKETDNGLETRMQFDSESEFAMKIFSLYQRGFLNTFSVGFNPTKRILETIDGTEEKGIVWTEAELLEYSAVPVPANPGAMVAREDAEALIKTLGDSFFTKSADGSFQVKTVQEDEQKNQKAFEVQTLIFPKSKWDSAEKCQAWAKEHEFKSDKVDETEDSFRLRQRDPGEFEEMRTICMIPDSEMMPDDEDCMVKAVGGNPKEQKPESVKQLETSLKGLIDLSKTIKGQKLDDNKIILVKTSLAVLQDLITDDEIGMTRKEFDDLQTIVKQCSDILKNRHPKSSDVVSKFMSQLTAALKGFRAN